MSTQWIISAVTDGSVYLLVALGFGLLYRTVHFFDFSFAALLCLAPYATLVGMRVSRGNLAAAIIFGTLASAVVAILFEVVCFERLRLSNASKNTSLLVSLGLFVVVRNTIGAVWGDQVLLLQEMDTNGGFAVMGGRMTSLQAWTVLLAIVSAVGIASVVEKSRWGLCIKAVANDRVLARSVGIPEPKVIGSVYVLAAVSASVAGLSLALDVGMTPNMGFRPYLFAAVAVVLAGEFSVGKIIIASVFVATVQNVVIWQLGAPLQEGSIFGIFLIVVVSRSLSRQWRPVLKAR